MSSYLREAVLASPSILFSARPHHHLSLSDWNPVATTAMSRAWLPTFMSGRSSTAPQQAVEDDDWSDISSIGDSPTGSNSSNRPSDGSIDADTKARLLSNMPSIFSTALPPCGLHPQCAFENVNNRLRKLWLQQSHDPALRVTTIDICKIVSDELDAEDKDFPHGTLRLTKSRRPWRLEGVFKYELLWSRWFIREAEIQERLPQMNEAEVDRQDFMDRLYPIPKELRIIVKDKINKKGILSQWKAWGRVKRGLPPVTEQPDVPVTKEDMSLGGVVREALTNVNNPPPSSENEISPEPAFVTDARET
ncbi:hypothetical protein T440DRAFT_388163 [Plenodomus tracheiphilus IPT5]|uniref:Uncharacterized protein n=1 Tax=Plenodomus tracheiphilus IPT5 TaxID=1408161 RepID=A0A6A7BI81_9PLEO|nr:hypothetical protein T440DRAFT_388163 [Plenodomus tracheiphilus IPT5]